MSARKSSLVLMTGVLLFGCGPDPIPPVAKVEPKTLEIHGDSRVDNYFWMNQRDNPEVRAYLEKENEYTEAMMGSTESLQQTLFEEFKGRIKQTDESVPYRMGDYFYYSRSEDGKSYPIYCRKKGSLDAAEEIMLDANELATGKDFYSVSGRAVSTSGDLLAFAEDTAGRRIYTLRFKDLTSGEFLPDQIPGVTSNIVWANDNKTIFYAKQDPQTLRWHRIYRHTLGTAPENDVLVFEEKDVTFGCSVQKTRSQKYILIASWQTLSTEYRYCNADRPTGSFTVFQPRERDHDYTIDHSGNDFFIRTNWKARNFRLMRTPEGATAKRNWKEVLPHRTDVLLEGVEAFRAFVVTVERKEGLRNLHILPVSGTGEHLVDFGEPAYLAYVGDNEVFDTRVLRYGYTSMTTPSSVFDYDIATHEKKLLKEEEVLGGFDKADYVTERLWAPARDGKKVPISVVYRKDTPRDGTRPLLLYGYGSYGASRDASFSPYRISLLDRGFVYAIGHIRGGEELGREWYEDGKLLNKKNTFTDFIDCAKFLVGEKYVAPDKLFAQGGSAGGLLIGAVINMEPTLLKGVIAAVPWVDVVTTMLDETIPLTTSEYDEWGNPNDKQYYDYMLSYSPYDQVEAKDYPNMLVTTSFHDSQVQYWEPAKWVAKLRAMKTDHNRLLLKTRMQAGHGGASGRYDRYKDVAFEYAFLLDLAGIRK